MTNKIWQPSADIFHCADQWYVKLELAGIAPDNITIMARGNTLSVSGTRRDTQERSNPFYHSLEIAYSNFSRTIRLPVVIDQDSISWEYQDGMLLIQFDGREE